jgi:hypothetical protein
MKRIRQSNELEIIAAFLQGEYYQKEYHGDRNTYEVVVMNPNLADEEENRIRRELLYRRHRVTWKVLPGDINWFQVELEADDFERIRVFPRGHWPKLATDSSLAVRDMARTIRNGQLSRKTQDDVSAIHAIADRLQQQPDYSSVLLIGIDETKPLTILEGNHRMIAAALTSTETIPTFKVYAGFSPLMTSCFWYQATLENMLRYAYRRLLELQLNLVRGLKQLWASLAQQSPRNSNGRAGHTKEQN